MDGSAQTGKYWRVTTKLPVFPAEDHLCERCALRYSDLSYVDVLLQLTPLAAQIRRLVTSGEPAQLTVRASADEWSAVEYLCHLRDVFVTSTIRLHRARTEENPHLDPMLNDLRVRRFRYNDWPVAAVLDEIDATSMGFIDEVQRLSPSDFERVATGPMGDQRTALWFVRHALHEALHHRDDVARLVG
jgi:DinB superfamily